MNYFKDKEFKFIDLFSGIGGFHQAMSNIGGKCVLASEIDKWAIESYQLNYGIDSAHDITKIKDEEVPQHDVLCGGFPCQDVSIAGKQAGIVKGKTRSGLMYELLRVIEKLKPKYVIAENVKNILSYKHVAQLEEFLCILSKFGYAVTMDLLNASDYGIPQNRERLFIVGVRND